jgi:hypothetical protein
MTKYFVYFIILMSVAFVGCSSTKVESDDTSQSLVDGMPFGKITDSDTDQLMQFAKERGFDLSSELQKAYAKDTNALARVFRFSLTFKSLDQNARTYGQVIYSSLLNLGETIGPEQYSSVLVAQNLEVQQRVRDFLYFPITRVPKKEGAQADKEVREDFPKLFPNDYQFGHDDPLFKR